MVWGASGNVLAKHGVLAVGSGVSGQHMEAERLQVGCGVATLEVDWWGMAASLEEGWWIVGWEVPVGVAWGGRG